jgi:hypothetical protein
VPNDASRVHHLASWARVKDKHGEVRALFCRNWWKPKRKGNKMEQEVKKWRWKINHASKGVVVNGLGNGISRIMWTQGKKGARSISEKDQAPGAPLRLVSNLCIY